MRRRAVAVVATQVISPVMAMLVALVIALILLLAAPVKAQETSTEETTVLAANAADRKVEAKTDNVSVEVDNGKVSVSTDDGSSPDGTGQQSSLTVQQNQTDEGSGSRASTGDVNVARTSNNFTIVVNRRNGAQVASDSTNRDTTNQNLFVTQPAGNYELRVTVRPQSGTTFSVRVDDCRSDSSTNSCNDPVRVASMTQSDADGRLDFTTDRDKFRVSYTVNFRDSNNNNNDGRNRHRHRHRHRDRDRDRHHNRFFGRGAANFQYERIVEERVIRETIPDKGRLAATGGVPLTGAAFLGLASVGLGVSILRSAIRRDP